MQNEKPSSFIPEYTSDKKPTRSSVILLQSLYCWSEDTTHGGTHLHWACPPQKEETLKGHCHCPECLRKDLSGFPIQAYLISTAEQFWPTQSMLETTDTLMPMSAMFSESIQIPEKPSMAI